ncbi:hypothetical protein LLS1_26490 [Leifsonia sp. LS1]|uniref:hypothetical protein n=1 Tax=Leifsonia sp. LS1 TaxID=2828483 RepID=UPI001CFD62D2|nr:hypothetical protein [Leifsonia sp. LS1]GIT80980.1 hypothetical protein LLS1_26490 [Leifsonia sp. LS1]
MSKGPWEKRLADLASAKADVTLPNAAQLVSQLNALKRITSDAQSGVGLEGETGEAATSALQSVASKADDLSQKVASIHTQVESANSTRKNLANSELDKLDADAPGALSSGQANILQAAVTGATFFLGPLSIVAGPGAVAAVNSYLAANRESTARASVQKISETMDSYKLSVSSDFQTDGRLPDGGPGGSSSSSDQTPGGSSSGPGNGGRLPGGGSFGTYPNAHVEPLSQVDTGGYVSIPGGHTGTGHTGTGSTPGTGIDGSITPDGPISGGTTTPGWGSGGSGGGGSLGGGLGSTPGLAAGAGGALALGGAKLVAARGGSMVGSGLNAKVGSLGAGAKVGGLNAAAESAGARTGALAGAGRAGSGGLLGSGQGGAGGAGAAAEGAAARGGTGAGAGMMGGAGGAGRSDEKRQGRGLGGPIAPKIDEDQDRGPRSAAAGPGGRG